MNNITELDLKYAIESANHEQLKVMYAWQKDRIDELQRENEVLKSSLKRSHEAAVSLNERHKDLAIMKHTSFNDDECWIFDEDNLEDNHLESLVCPVVIRARTLRELFASKEKIEREKVELAALVDEFKNTLLDNYRLDLQIRGVNEHEVDKFVFNFKSHLEETSPTKCLDRLKTISYKAGFYKAKQVYKCELGICGAELQEYVDEYLNKEI